jgi:threonine/homoserine/homoserine lactone efflux protein
MQLALLVFAAAATITPGPNNIMVMTAGANFGLRRTAPHLLGIAAGVLAVILLTGLGLMALLDRLPMLQRALQIGSTLYMLWLAWKIATANPPAQDQPAGQPLSFNQAALFQAINPKIWASGLSAVTLFASGRAVTAVLAVALVLALTGIAANTLWAGMGTILRRGLRRGHRLRAFNIAMALLLVASLYPAWR